MDDIYDKLDEITERLDKIDNDGINGMETNLQDLKDDMADIKEHIQKKS